MTMTATSNRRRVTCRRNHCYYTTTAIPSGARRENEPSAAWVMVRVCVSE